MSSKEREERESTVLIYSRGLEDGLEYAFKELEAYDSVEEARVKMSQLLYRLKVMKMNRIDRLFLF